MMIHVLDFLIDENLVVQNQQELSDMIRLAFYKENPSLFQKLIYDDDNIFLEPTLFHYFSGNKNYKNKVSLELAVYGYISGESKPEQIIIESDKFGMVNLPNIGYLKIEPNSQGILFKIKDKEAITNSGTMPIIPNIYVESTKIRLCLHPTDLITQRFETTFVETVQDTAIKYQRIIDNTASIFQNVTPDFLRLLKTTCRELVVFNSETQYSMAALSYYGVGFINVANETRKKLFFVDDIAHQCGHVIYHALTLKVENFLKVHKESPLKEFTYIDGESRTVYGAFHGLFTYTTILHSLDKCLDNSIFHENEKHEAIGRLGFYMDKFQKDLEHMNDKRILTNQGFEFYEMFLSGYKKIKKKYRSLLFSLDYKNQPYLFNYKLFQAINPLK